ncbi:MAG: hypothetical protein H0U74_13995 [Bradymonadaceae bacterium]|nr:hypothetical protein [Lujinxingiaceae bacterium]
MSFIGRIILAGAGVAFIGGGAYGLDTTLEEQRFECTRSRPEAGVCHIIKVPRFSEATRRDFPFHAIESVTSFERTSSVGSGKSKKFCGAKFSQPGNPKDVTLYSLECTPEIRRNAEVAADRVNAFFADPSEEHLSMTFERDSFYFGLAFSGILFLIGLGLLTVAVFDSEKKNAVK